MPLTPGIQIVGRFEIIAPLGAGSMGEVYQAHDLKLRRDVALKLLSPALATSEEHLLRFEREARAASALNHPHICTIYDVGQAPEADGRPYLVMELLRGVTLYEAMAAGPLSVRDGDRPRRADRRCARRRARRRHHPSRSEAGQHLRDRARRRQAARFRPRRGDRRRGRRTVERQRSPHGRAHQPRHRGRHGALHVAGAGARRSARCAHRHLLARPRALRDAHRPPRLRRAIDDGDRRCDPAPSPPGSPPPTCRRAEGAPPAGRRGCSRRIARSGRRRAAEIAARLRAVQSGSMAGREYAATSPVGASASTPLDVELERLPPARRRSRPPPRSRRQDWARRWRAGKIRDAITVAVAAGAGRARRLRRLLAGIAARRRQPATREPLLLADFSNTTGEAVFDGALKDALEIQLQQSPYVKRAADLAGALRAAADGAIAERAADRGGRARSVRAARRQGDPARLDCAAQLGLRDHARGAGLPHRRHAGARPGAGGVEDRRARHRRQRRGAHPRAARRVDRLDSEVQRAGAERDDAVARGAEGLQPGHRRPASAPATCRRFRSSSTRSSSIPNFALAAARLGAIYTNLRDFERRRPT